MSWNTEKSQVALDLICCMISIDYDYFIKIEFYSDLLSEIWNSFSKWFTSARATSYYLANEILIGRTSQGSTVWRRTITLIL